MMIVLEHIWPKGGALEIHFQSIPQHDDSVLLDPSIAVRF